MCECVEQLNQQLADKNTRLSVTFRVGNGNKLTDSLMIQTEVIVKKRGAVPLVALPSYCPFCGEKYA